MSNNNLRISSDLVFAVLLALVSATLNYRFGVGNQVEQIPLILNRLDPGYLAGDFFVETGRAFGPRIYFVQFLAWLSKLAPLHWVYYLLTVLSNLALVLVTQWAARRIIGADRLGAALASVMVLGLASFHLGDATQIRYEIFQPASLAIPGALWAIGLGLCGRPVAAALVAVLSSLPHPLYGAQGGAIALGTAFFVLLLRAVHWRPPYAAGRVSIGPLAWREALVGTALGMLILGAFLAVFWWWPYRNVNAAGTLSTAEFFSILADFRAPHHYYPSYFRPTDYVTAILFMFAAGLAYERWSRAVPRLTAGLLLLPLLAVFAACVAGTLFTEVWQLRSILTLQPFRLFSIVKWLGFMLIAYVLASYWRQPPTALARPLVALGLLSTGVTHPLVNAMVLGLIRVKPWIISKLPEWLWVSATGLVAVLLWLKFGALGEAIYLVIALGLVIAFSGRQFKLRAIAVLTVAVLMTALAWNRDRGAIDIAPLRPLLALSDHRAIDAETARAVARYTPVDALLIAPPQFGLLRIIGGRALVVDFKSIPFQDPKMREWRERMRVVYGDVEAGGFAAARALEQAYRQVSDAHLLSLARQYDASHALLYADTETRLPVLYANETYRLVSLSQP